jgi:four helix bundle protein
MTNQNQSNKKYDLAERTAKFGERIIDFCKMIKRDPITTPIINQLVRCGTSIGANYHEANEANSKKDFANKINIAQKESKETKYWLQMIIRAVPENKEDAEILCKEAHELNLIFAAIVRKTTAKNDL